MKAIRIINSQIKEIEAYLNSADDYIIKNNGVSSAEYLTGTIDGVATVLKFLGMSCLKVNGAWHVGLLD